MSSIVSRLLFFGCRAGEAAGVTKAYTDSPIAINPGTKLGPYEIIAQVGSGGMGEVYRAMDSRLDREVAIKVLPQNLAKDPAALKRFEREMKAVAALSHPNILDLHD